MNSCSALSNFFCNVLLIQLTLTPDRRVHPVSPFRVNRLPAVVPTIRGNTLFPSLEVSDYHVNEMSFVSFRIYSPGVFTRSPLRITLSGGVAGAGDPNNMCVYPDMASLFTVEDMENNNGSIYTCNLRLDKAISCGLSVSNMSSETNRERKRIRDREDNVNGQGKWFIGKITGSVSISFRENVYRDERGGEVVYVKQAERNYRLEVPIVSTRSSEKLKTETLLLRDLISSPVHLSVERKKFPVGAGVGGGEMRRTRFTQTRRLSVFSVKTETRCPMLLSNPSVIGSPRGTRASLREEITKRRCHCESSGRLCRQEFELEISKQSDICGSSGVYYLHFERECMEETRDEACNLLAEYPRIYEKNKSVYKNVKISEDEYCYSEGSVGELVTSEEEEKEEAKNARVSSQIKLIVSHAASGAEEINTGRSKSLNSSREMMELSTPMAVNMAKHIELSFLRVVLAFSVAFITVFCDLIGLFLCVLSRLFCCTCCNTTTNTTTTPPPLCCCCCCCCCSSREHVERGERNRCCKKGESGPKNRLKNHFWITVTGLGSCLLDIACVYMAVTRDMNRGFYEFMGDCSMTLFFSACLFWFMCFSSELFFQYWNSDVVENSKIHRYFGNVYVCLISAAFSFSLFSGMGYKTDSVINDSGKQQQQQLGITWNDQYAILVRVGDYMKLFLASVIVLALGINSNLLIKMKITPTGYRDVQEKILEEEEKRNVQVEREHILIDMDRNSKKFIASMRSCLATVSMALFTVSLFVLMWNLTGEESEARWALYSLFKFLVFTMMIITVRMPLGTDGCMERVFITRRRLVVISNE